MCAVFVQYANKVIMLNVQRLVKHGYNNVELAGKRSHLITTAFMLIIY